MPAPEADQVEAALYHALGDLLLVKPEVARKQLDAETVKLPAETVTATTTGGEESGPTALPEDEGPEPPVSTQPKRFHGTVNLDAARVGRDAGRIAEEVIAHLVGLDGAKVTVTLDVAAEIPSGAPDHVVRTVTENSRTLGFTSQGFEEE